MGLLMPEMIPDFVVSKQELFAQFPSLAPPDYNASADDSAKPADEPLIPDLDSILNEDDTFRSDSDAPHTLTEELDEELVEDLKEE